ncbi:MAG: hypothetical protein ISR95_01000 [Candidatus Marinimicrobia bacterium]|nr:hypothetical protein [Candidatus Neomarinimicrobiota bacterium]
MTGSKPSECVILGRGKGKRCQGRTPLQTFLDNLNVAKEKAISNIQDIDQITDQTLAA